MTEEPDNKDGVKAYLPPEGPQNIHQVPYTYREEQGAHNVGTFVVESPEMVIITGDQDAYRQFDNTGLDSLPDDVAQEALEALREDDDGTLVSIVEAHTEGKLRGEKGQTDDDQEPEIPDDLESVDYRELQDLAQDYEIKATQTAEELRVALSSVRDGDGIPEDIDTADNEDTETTDETADESGVSAYQSSKGSDESE